MATIATLDLKSIRELYLEVKKEYSGYSESYLYFLSTCFYLDPYLNLDIALKLRPYGGLIGFDNSTLDIYFKSYKILNCMLFFMTLPHSSLNTAKKDQVILTSCPVRS